MKKKGNMYVNRCCSCKRKKCDQEGSQEDPTVAIKVARVVDVHTKQRVETELITAKGSSPVE